MKKLTACSISFLVGLWAQAALASRLIPTKQKEEHMTTDTTSGDDDTNEKLRNGHELKTTSQDAVDSNLKFISETHRREFHNRCKYEWMTLTITLTFFVLAVSTSLKEGFLNTCLVICILVTVILALAVISTCYLMNIHAANAMNKKFAEAAENTLITNIGENNLINERNNMEKERENRKDWSLHWQRGTILVFAAASILIIITSGGGDKGCKILHHSSCFFHSASVPQIQSQPPPKPVDDKVKATP